MKTLCIDPNDMNQYFEGKMTAEEKDTLETHIVQCKSCLELFINVKEIFYDTEVMAFANDPVSDGEAQRILDNVKNRFPINKAKLKLQQLITSGKDKLSDMVDCLSPIELVPVRAIRSDSEVIKYRRSDDCLCLENIQIMIKSQSESGVTIKAEVIDETIIHGRLILNKKMSDSVYEDDDKSPDQSLKNNCVTFKQTLTPGFYRLKFIQLPQTEMKEYFFYINHKNRLQHNESVE